MASDMKSVIDGSYAKKQKKYLATNNYGYVKAATQTMETMMTSTRESYLELLMQICWIQYAPSLTMCMIMKTQIMQWNWTG